MRLFQIKRALKRRIEELEKENAILHNKTTFCRPPRPGVIFLLANVSGSQWLWYWRVFGEGGFYWHNGNGLWSSAQFEMVDERYSDTLALALWKVESEKARKEQERLGLGKPN